MITFFIFILILALDQVTKYLIVNNFTLYQSRPIIDNIFHLTYVQNRGAAFGVFQGQITFFIIVTFLVLAMIIYFYHQLPLDNFSNRLALGLALAGTIGNLIDRIRLGYVIDFLDFRIWPVFNVADSAIVISVTIFAYWILVLDNNQG